MKPDYEFRKRAHRVRQRLWRPVQLTEPGGISRKAAWTVVLGLWSVGWLAAVVNAIVYLSFPEAFGGTLTFAKVARYLIASLAVGATGLGVLLLVADATRTPAVKLGIVPSVSWSSFKSGFRIYAIAYTALFLGVMLLNDLVQQIPGVPRSGSYPSRPFADPGTAALSVFDSAFGGAVEEIVMLAMLVVVLRAAKTPWWQIGVVGVILRASFHVYYGPIALPGFILWAAALLALYATTARFWPIFIAHMTQNGLITLGRGVEQFRPELAEVVAAVHGVWLLLAVVVGIWTAVHLYAVPVRVWWTTRHRRKKLRTAARSSAGITAAEG